MILLVAMTAGLFGCTANNGNIVSNPGAMSILSGESTSSYNLYVYGNSESPTALVGLTGGYRMDSRLWKPLTGAVPQAVRPSRRGYGWGFDIVSADGQKVGVLASSVHRYTLIKVDMDNKIVSLAPYFKVGGTI